MVRLQRKTLIVVIFGVFLTLYMVVYVSKTSDLYFESDKSEVVRYRIYQDNSSITIKTFHNLISKIGGYFYINSKLVLNSKELDNNLNSQRRRHLEDVCESIYGSERVLKLKPSKLDHILIDQKHKILFCYIPKVACTNWKRIFMVLTGKATNISQVLNKPANELHTRNLFTTLQNYSSSEASQILQTYKKIIFVRNPFERILSAYRNKLEQHYASSKYFQERVGKYIVKNFRKNATNTALEKGDDVTFAEFADYLIASKSSSFNEHWQIMSDLCYPCFIHYDFIGKYDTLIDDSNFLLKYLNLNFTFPVLPKPSQTASILKKYFSSLTKDVIYKLYKIYEMDYKLFGYDLSNTS